MPALQYGTQAYRRDTGSIPDLRLRNLYMERTPVPGSDPILIQRPGLLESSNVGAGPIRGLGGQQGAFSDAVVAVSGTSAYVGSVNVGTIGGSDIVRIASSGTEALLVSGLVLYRTNGSAMSTVSLPGGIGVSDVGILKGYFVGTRAESNRFHWSAQGDGTTWDALDFASADMKPDNLVAVMPLGDFLWLFGTQSVEIWATTGDGDAPFARIEGRLYEKGCMARDTIAICDNGLFFVASDGMVCRAGAAPERVSTNAIEERIRGSNASTLRAWSFVADGHSFYVLRTDEGTFAYDVSTGLWCEFSSYGRVQFSGHVGVTIGSTTYVGDDRDGRIYTLDPEGVSDDSDPIQWEFDAFAPVKGAGVPCDRLYLECSVGRQGSLSATPPQVERRISRDGGNTWGDWRAVTLGAEGGYRTLPEWRRNGTFDAPGAIVGFRVAAGSPAPLRISGVYMNERPKGRSR